MCYQRHVVLSRLLFSLYQKVGGSTSPSAPRSSEYRYDDAGEFFNSITRVKSVRSQGVRVQIVEIVSLAENSDMSIVRHGVIQPESKLTVRGGLLRLLLTTPPFPNAQLIQTL